jgi:hypothetical protein
MLVTGSASAAPAVDEYGANLPSAGGDKTPGAGVPRGEPEKLPPTIAEQLDRSSKGKELAAVATSEQLGAPETAVIPRPSFGTAADDDSGKSFISAAAGSLGAPLVLALIAVLVLSPVGAWRLRRRSQAA